MKQLSLLSVTLLLGILTVLSSCEAIGQIFKAGVWSGIILVVILVAVVIFVIGKVSGGKKG
jgi:hypothetical protein